MEFKTLTSGMKIISFRNINKKKNPWPGVLWQHEMHYCSDLGYVHYSKLAIEDIKPEALI